MLNSFLLTAFLLMTPVSFIVALEPSCIEFVLSSELLTLDV